MILLLQGSLFSLREGGTPGYDTIAIRSQFVLSDVEVIIRWIIATASRNEHVEI